MGEKERNSNLMNRRNSAYEANKINEYKLYKVSYLGIRFFLREQIDSMGDLDNFVMGFLATFGRSESKYRKKH